MDEMPQAGPDPDVLVAGGGVAGLACAIALAEAGQGVTVLEADTRLGGRAASWPDETTGDTVDIGPHVVTSEHRNFLALLQRLGTAHHIHWQPTPLITLLDAGRRLRMRVPGWPVPLHGLPALPNALRCVGPSDLLSATRLAWLAARLGGEPDMLRLDDEDARSFLRRLGVRPRLQEWFFASAVMALLNVPLEHCSAAALMRVFRLMLGRSGYCFGFPTAGLAELFAPAARARIEAAGGRVLTGTRVDALWLDGGRTAGVQLQDGRRLQAGNVVLALPPRAVQALAEKAGTPALAPLAKAAGAFAPSPYVSTYLWFDRPLGRERFWARVLSPSDLNTDFYDLSAIRTPDAGRPSLVACNAIHALRAWHRDDAELVARTREEIAEFAPAARQARLLHARVHRVPMAVPCPRPGTERLRPPNATALPGLWLAGDWTDTALPCSMESAARSGFLAAEALAARLGHPLLVSIAPPETTGAVALLRRPVPAPA